MKNKDSLDTLCTVMPSVTPVCFGTIAVCNGNYDSYMHKFGPESAEALAELRANVRSFGMFCELIEENWNIQGC